uniref:Uncharacterized protein n=1 Tax=Daphnia magna TaxID=35525 RepID=A0A0P5XU96_9CRUS
MFTRAIWWHGNQERNSSDSTGYIFPVSPVSSRVRPLLPSNKFNPMVLKLVGGLGFRRLDPRKT